jgi:hypothetical protein
VAKGTNDRKHLLLQVKSSMITSNNDSHGKARMLRF